MLTPQQSGRVVQSCNWLTDKPGLMQNLNSVIKALQKQIHFHSFRPQFDDWML